MKRARKLSLISVFDFPRSDYGAYWACEVTGSDADGWRGAARLFSYEPLGFEWQGKVHPTWPEGVAKPEYPSDKHLLRDVAYNKLNDAGKAAERKRQEEYRARCAQIYEAHPKAVYLIAEGLDVFKSEEDARRWTQSWVLERIAHHRKPSVPTLSDDDVKALADEFDGARALKNWGRVDEIRGLLKSRGVAIKEPTSQGAPSSWKRNKQSGHSLVITPVGILGETILEGLRRLGRLLFPVILMALAYSSTIRNNRLVQVRDAVDGGAGAGKWRIYNGTRPATCGTATTLGAEMTMSDPCAGAPSGGVLTFSAITADTSADASITASWFRIVDSTGTCCVDGNVGTAGSDLNLNSTTITSGQEVSITSATITEGNP